MEADGEWSDGSDDALKSGSATGVSDGEDESKNEEKKNVPSSKLLRTDPVNAILDKIDAELGAMKSFSNSSQAKSSKPVVQIQSVGKNPTTSSTVPTATHTKPQQQKIENLHRVNNANCSLNKAADVRDVTSGMEPVKDGESYHSDLDSVAAEQIDEKFKEIMKKKRGGYLEDLKLPNLHVEKKKNDELKSNMNHSKVTRSLDPISSPDLPYVNQSQFKCSGYASDLDSIKTEDFENKFSELLVKDGSCDSVYQGQIPLRGIGTFEQTKALGKGETSSQTAHITLNHIGNKTSSCSFTNSEETVPKTILVKKDPTAPRSMLSIYGRSPDQQTQETSLPTCTSTSMFKDFPQSSGHNARIHPQLKRSFSLDEKSLWNQNREDFRNSLFSSKSTADESDSFNYSSSLKSLSSLDSVFSCKESNAWDGKSLMSRQFSTKSLSSGYAAEVDLSSNDSRSQSVSSTDLLSDGMKGHGVKNDFHLDSKSHLDHVLDRVLTWDISSGPVCTNSSVPSTDSDAKSKLCFSTGSESDATSGATHSRDLIMPEEITDGIPFAKQRFVKQPPVRIDSISDSFHGFSKESSITSDTSCFSESVSQCHSGCTDRRESVVNPPFPVCSPIATPDQNFSMANFGMMNTIMNPMGASAERILMNLGFGGSAPFLPERFLKSWYEKLVKAQFEQQRLLLAQMETLSQQQPHLMAQGKNQEHGQAQHQHEQGQHCQQNHPGQASVLQQTFTQTSQSHQNQYQYDIPKQNQQTQQHPMDRHFYGQQNLYNPSPLPQHAHPFPQQFYASLPQVPSNFQQQNPQMPQQALKKYESQPQPSFQLNQKAGPFKNSQTNVKDNSTESNSEIAKVHNQSSRMMQNTRLAKLRDYLESHAGLLNISKVSTNESRRKQFANRKQSSLPVSLDALTEVEEPVSNKNNVRVIGKQVKKSLDIKPSKCISGCGSSESDQSSDCVTEGDIENRCFNKGRDPSYDTEIYGNKESKSKEIKYSTKVQERVVVKNFSNDSLEVAEIMDKTNTVEPAMVSIILQDVDGNVKKSSQEAVNSDGPDNSYLHVPLSASNSLSPIPQSPVTVIEAAALDNQFDSLDMDDAISKNADDLATKDVTVSVDDGSQSPLIWNSFQKQENENDIGVQVDDGRLSPIEMFCDYEKLLQVVKDLGGTFYLSSDASVQYDLEDGPNISSPPSNGSLVCSSKNFMSQNTVFSDSDSSASDSSSAFLTISSNEHLSPPVRRRNSKNWDLKKSKSLSRRRESVIKSLVVPSSPIFVITNEDGVENSIDPDSPEVESPLLFRPIKNEDFSSSSTTGSFKVKNPSARRLSRSGKLSSRKLSEYSSDIAQSTSFETDMSYSDLDYQSEESTAIVPHIKKTVYRCNSIEQECQTEIDWHHLTKSSSPYTKSHSFDWKCSICLRSFEDSKFAMPNNFQAKEQIFAHANTQDNGMNCFKIDKMNQFLTSYSQTDEEKLPINNGSEKDDVEQLITRCSETDETEELTGSCFRTVMLNQLVTNCPQTDEPKQLTANCSQTDESKQLITTCSQTDESKQLITNSSQTDETKPLITSYFQTDSTKALLTNCTKKDETRETTSIFTQTDDTIMFNTYYSQTGNQNKFSSIAQSDEFNALLDNCSQTDNTNNFKENILCQTDNINNVINNYSQTCMSYFICSDYCQIDEKKIGTKNQITQTQNKSVLSRSAQTSSVVRTCEAFSQTAMKDKVNRQTNSHADNLHDNCVNGDNIVVQNNYGKDFERRFTSNATFAVKGNPLKEKKFFRNQQNDTQEHPAYNGTEVASVIRTCRESDSMRKSVKDLASLFDRS